MSEHHPSRRTLLAGAAVSALLDTSGGARAADDAFHPHLRRSEFAVVDLSDHQPAQGELFPISYGNALVDCGRTFALCQMIGRTRYRRPAGGWVQHPEASAEPATCWMARHWIPPADLRDCDAARRSGRVGTSEGPFTTEHAAEKLVGRVVGVWVPAVSYPVSRG